MIGHDVIVWLEGIWYDLTHLAAADIPSLAVKVFLLLIGGLVLLRFVRSYLRSLWRACLEPLWFHAQQMLMTPWLIYSERRLKWKREENELRAREFRAQREREERAQQAKEASERERQMTEIRRALEDL